MYFMESDKAGLKIFGLCNLSSPPFPTAVLYSSVVVEHKCFQEIFKWRILIEKYKSVLCCPIRSVFITSPRVCVSAVHPGRV